MKLLLTIFFTLIFLFNLSAQSSISTTIIKKSACDTERDSSALVDLYEDTNGDNWKINTGWKVAGTPIRDWYGVFVNAEGCVETLDLDGMDNGTFNLSPLGNELNGVLPQSIGDLSELKNIYLTDNFLLGENIPSSLFDIATLEEIYFDNCGFDKPVPSNISTAPSLISAILDNNSFTFEDILHVIPFLKSISNDYSPQDSVYVDITLVKNVGETLLIDLIFDDTVTTNQYFWFKDSVPFDTIFGVNELSIPNLKQSDAGVYKVHIINTIADSLRLLSKEITVIIDCVPTDSDLPMAVCVPTVTTEISTGSITPNFSARNVDNGSSDNCSSLLYFSFSSDIGDSSTFFTCDDLGVNQVQIWVTDEAGNQQNCTIAVTVEDNAGFCKPVLESFTKTDLTCNKNNSGAIDLVVSGSSSITFQWSPGGYLTEDISNLPAGNYSVTISNPGGQITRSFLISEPDEITVLDEIKNQICTDPTTGNIRLTPSGGTPNYQYIWNTGATSNFIQNLNPGNYAVSITDENDCEFTESYSVGIDQTISNLSTSTTFCDDNNQVLINLNFQTILSGNFEILEGNTSYGTFNYGELPASFGPFTEDATRVYDFELKDQNFLNCIENFQVGPIVCTPPPCRFKDSVELARFYNLTGGTNWTPIKWNLVEPITSWDGIRFDSNGCVTKINLTRNNLTGDFPNLDLEFLDTLIVERNRLTGPIPDFDLPNLTFVDCSLNDLSGNFPSLSKTPKLRFLDCDFNRIDGSIPNFDLPKLQVFDCNVNALTDSIPNFTKLPSLRFFDCSRNQLEGKIPTFNLSPRLVKFYAHINMLEGEIPNLSHLLELSEIRADSNQLSGCLPIDWDFCNLDTFDFRKNKRLPWEGDLANMCPPQNLDPLNAPCDDLNQLTLNDSIRMDCSCVGCPLAFTELSPTLCFGDSIVVNGIVYNKGNPSGIQIIPISSYCDSTISIQPIFLDQVVAEDDSAKICAGDSINWRGRFLKEERIYFDTVSNFLGCDSLTFEFKLSLLEKSEKSNSAQFCEGGTYLWRGMTLNSTGIFYDTLRSTTLGCDSITYQLNLTETNILKTDTVGKICQGDTLIWNNQTITDSGKYEFFTQTILGCDSLITFEVTQATSPNPLIFREILCEGEEYFWRNEIFTDTGTYVRIIPAIDGCDTSATLILEEQNQADIEAVDDFFTFSPDSSVMTFSLFENDKLPFGKRFSLISEPMDGDISVIEPGYVQYTPNDQSINGQVIFEYKICYDFCAEICDTAQVIINIDGNCFEKAKEEITNAFSPNDDNTNDFFDPLVEYIELGCDVNESNAEMTIINRWGERIFAANPYQPWSGKTSGGRTFPEATYYFILKIETINNPIKGPINLIEIKN